MPHDAHDLLLRQLEVLELVRLLEKGVLEIPWHHVEQDTSLHPFGEPLIEISFKSKYFRLPSFDHFEDLVALRDLLWAHYGHHKLQSAYWSRESSAS